MFYSESFVNTCCEFCVFYILVVINSININNLLDAVLKK